MSTAKPALPVKGGPGVPPPGAPQETTEPLKPEAIEDMKAKAAAHETQLKPLPPVPKGAPTLEELKLYPKGKPTGVSLKPSTAAVVDAAEALADPPPPPSPDGLNEPEPGGDETQETQKAQVYTPPAASDTDSPSKGMPKPQPKGKEVTGGWGEGPGQYFALDGSELATIIYQLMEDLKARIGVDLKFSIALTYPQVRCRVLVQIDGAEADAAINDIKFDLQEATIVHLEAMVTDTNQTPADMIRDDHGIKKPYKHTVRTGVGKLLADVEVTQ